MVSNQMDDRTLLHWKAAEFRWDPDFCDNDEEEFLF